jgi:hypothetical protein
MTELEIIHLALDNLQRNAHIKGKWTEAAPNRAFDGELLLTIDDKPIKYNIEIKNELRGHQLNQVLDLNKKHPPLMMVATHLVPKIKEELRQNNIAYMEANGNIFLKHNDILLWIETNKPLTVEKETGNRAFTKTGLKVVFEFLRNETWVNQTYQAIAEHTGTTVGNAYKIITGLQHEGFLLAVNKNEYKLNNKKELLEKWVVAYGEKLKPALRIGTFRFLKEDDFLKWKKKQLNTDKTLWGGEPAGDLLTNYLQPEELTLYTNEARNELVKNYRLIPDEKGNIKAYQKFWRRDDADAKTAPPLLVYADLINTNDRRCRETAQKIYDEFLQNKL